MQHALDAGCEPSAVAPAVDLCGKAGNADTAEFHDTCLQANTCYKASRTRADTQLRPAAQLPHLSALNLSSGSTAYVKITGPLTLRAQKLPFLRIASRNFCALRVV